MKHTLLILISFFVIISKVSGTENFTDNLTVPHTFKTGEIVSSQEMNDNFNLIFQELNRLRKFVYFNNEIIGEFIQFNFPALHIRTTKGYFMYVEEQNDNYYINSVNINFITSDCTGNMYTNPENFNYKGHNHIYRNSNKLYYVPPEVVIEQISYSSEYQSAGECTGGTESGNFVRIYENVENITGKNNTIGWEDGNLLVK